LSTKNQLALTYAFNNIPTLFNQYNYNSYEPLEINNFKFSAFQFLLFHGEFLSNLDPTTQKSILESITSIKQIELINNIVNFMIENPAATWAQIENWFMGTSEGIDGDYDASFWEDPNLTFQQQNLPTYNKYLESMARMPDGTLMKGADNIYTLAGGKVLETRLKDKEGTENTCALKVSIALVRSGIIIPNLPGSTIEGGGEFAGKFFFLNAKTLNGFMRKTFGTKTGVENTPINSNHYSYDATDGGVNGVDFPTRLKDKQGIYSMITTEAYDRNGSSGHSDLLFTDSKGYGNCAFDCFFNLPIQRIDIWILN
jgi:hypothetical protein